MPKEDPFDTWDEPPRKHNFIEMSFPTLDDAEGDLTLLEALLAANRSAQRLLADPPTVDPYKISKAFGRYVDKVRPLRSPTPTIVPEMPPIEE